MQFSSETPVVSFLFIRWQTSQVLIYTTNIGAWKSVVLTISDTSLTMPCHMYLPLLDSINSSAVS